MCAIFGFYRNNDQKEPVQTHLLKLVLSGLINACATRGRDGTGLTVFRNPTLLTSMLDKEVTSFRGPTAKSVIDALDARSLGLDVQAIIGNCRAEPTTEWQPDKDPNRLQPYSYGNLHAVHNGTIANDRQFLDVIRGTEGQIDSTAIPVAASWGRFQELVGSQATAMFNASSGASYQITPDIDMAPRQLVLHRNYRPLAVIYCNALGGWLFASKMEFLLRALPQTIEYRVVPMPAHHTLVLPTEDRVNNRPANDDHAVVILSGGLDSTTVAKLAVGTHSRTTLIHFHYGCRAQTKETEAVTLIAQRLQAEHAGKDIRLEFIDMSFLKNLGGSTLTDPDAQIAEGEAGAEFAHEWVPFRNGLMLSSIVAYCDRHKCSHIYLGANLEEAGAYGDNEEEFYELMNKAVAIGSISAPKIVNPLDNLMKHEIVALALKVGAPVDLSWSCYHGGANHCGNCGPCYMRQRAFAMNDKLDPVVYGNGLTGEQV